MKKFLVVLLLAALMLTLCACNTVPSTRFLSSAQIESAARICETPQAEVTLTYSVNNTSVKVCIVYDLLLRQAPLATLRFIELVNDGFYDNTVADTYNSTYGYLIMGRYSYVAESKKYYMHPSEETFKGEFKSNSYPQPADGYARFKMASLAMYHEDWTEENNTFDSANGYLMLMLSSEKLNPDNYAVFAYLSSVTVTRDGKESDPFTTIPSDVYTNLTSTSRTTRAVYNADETTTQSVSMLSTLVTIQARMLGDYDWSALPKVR